MKVIVVNAFSAKIGGGVTYIKWLIEYIPNNIDIRVYIFCADNKFYTTDSRVTFCKTLFPTNNPIFRLFWEFFFLPFFLFRVKADILFCPGGTVNTIVFGKCKVVTMFRNMLPFDMPSADQYSNFRLRFKNYLLRKSMLRSMSSVDLVIFISDYAWLLIENKIRLNSAITIYHGVNPRFKAATCAQSFPLPFSGNYILYVSRFEPYKRHIQLVSAYSLLSSEQRSKYKLLFVGGGEGIARTEVNNFISNNNLENEVFILEEIPHESLKSIYHRASLFAFMSSCENCPNILIEAMASSLPIICSNRMPMPEFGLDSVYYVNSDSVIDIKDALEKLICDASLRNGLAQKASNRSNMFDWQLTISKTWLEMLSLV